MHPKQAVAFWFLGFLEMLFLKVSCSVSETMPEAISADIDKHFLSSSVLKLKLEIFFQDKSERGTRSWG